MQSPLTQLLVHMDASPQAVQRLETACRLGHAHGAAVTALYAVTPAFVELPYAPELGGGAAAELREIDDGMRRQAHSAFEQVVAKPGLSAAWAEADGNPVMGIFAQQALYADMMVLGQTAPAGAQPAGVPSDFVETMLAVSGKPALILPYIGLTRPPGGTVVLAWKPTREAARAVSAALPLLRQAQRVHVVSWAEDDETVVGAGLNLRTYLHLHGVKPVWQHEGREPEQLGDLLLSRACDLDADLLVMGCYGHSRAREWILGGSSRTVLRSMTLPVLMAH